MKRNLLIATVIAVALVVMFWYGARHARSRRGATGDVGATAGKFAPGFQLKDVRTGKIVQLADFKGKAVLLNFWATWCPPCKVEIPWFVDLQQRYGTEGLQVVGVAMDDAGAPAIAKFANDMSVNYPVLQGTEKVADLYGGVDALPVTFYIGRDGRVAKQVFGLDSHREVEDNVKLVLNPGETAAGFPNDGGGRP